MTTGPRLELVPASPGRGSLDSIYRVYSGYVAGIAFRLLGRDQEVDDVIQDVFLAAARGLDQIRDDAAIKGWLATVTVRLAMRRLRLRRLRGFLGLDSVTENDIATASSDPANRVLLVRIYAVLDEIPAPERVAWLLHHVEGETLPAVADMCGCSLATIKRRISAAQRTIEGSLT